MTLQFLQSLPSDYERRSACRPPPAHRHRIVRCPPAAARFAAVYQASQRPPHPRSSQHCACALCVYRIAAACPHLVAGETRWAHLACLSREAQGSSRPADVEDTRPAAPEPQNGESSRGTLEHLELNPPPHVIQDP